MEKLEELKQKDTPLVVKFEADWCNPCQSYKPIFNDVTDEFGDQINHLTIDVEEHPDTSKKYKVLSVPMTVIFKDDEIVEREMGLIQKDRLKELINGHV